MPVPASPILVVLPLKPCLQNGDRNRAVGCQPWADSARGSAGLERGCAGGVASAACGIRHSFPWPPENPCLTALAAHFPWNRAPQAGGLRPPLPTPPLPPPPIHPAPNRPAFARPRPPRSDAHLPPAAGGQFRTTPDAPAVQTNPIPNRGKPLCLRLYMCLQFVNK